MREPETRSSIGRLIAPLAKFIDWSALQFSWALHLGLLQKPHAAELNPALQAAIEFLNGPDFIPTESRSARLDFHPDGSGRHFRFATPQPGEFAVNNVVYGRVYPGAERWRERPAIILLHGAGDFLNHRFRFPRVARRCNQAGFNAATLVLPYHFQRCPRDLQSWGRTGYYVEVAKTFAQAVAEIRALTGWLLGEGCPAVVLWGISLGGWLAGLTASRDGRLAAVVLTIPGVGTNLNLVKGEAVVWPRVRQFLEKQRSAYQALNRTPLNLTSLRPVIAQDRILLIEGVHDLWVGSETIEELWRAWERPEIWRLPHGHISLMGVPGLTDRVLGWLSPRLDSAGHGEIERRRVGQDQRGAKSLLSQPAASASFPHDNDESSR